MLAKPLAQKNEPVSPFLTTEEVQREDVHYLATAREQLTPIRVQSHFKPYLLPGGPARGRTFVLIHSICS
jgi:hypothetical protein